MAFLYSHDTDRIENIACLLFHVYLFPREHVYLAIA
jgi:hypothetical protein